LLQRAGIDATKQAGARSYLRDHDHEVRGVIPPAYYTSLTDLLTRMVTALHTGQPMKVGLPGRTHLATPIIEDGGCRGSELPRDQTTR